MAVVALAGGLGAPGVTTTAMALLLTWPLETGHRVVLAECDPDGGAILPGALQGTLGNTHGLRNLGLAGRQGQLGDAFWRQLIDVTDAGSRDRLVLPGFFDPMHASSMGPVWDQLAGLFGSIEQHRHDVLIDLGRRGTDGPSAVLAQRADVVLMVARNTLRGLQSAEVRLTALREQLGTTAEVGLVMIDRGPFSVDDVRRNLKADVVATLPWRPAEAEVLSDGAPQPRKFEQGELMRSARSATARLRQMIAARRARLGAPGGRAVSGAR
jgi:hypothetical protein